MPARGERAGLGFAIADDTRDDEVRVIQGCTVGVHERIAELSALVDRPGQVGGGVRGDAARRRELAEEGADAGGILGDARVDLGVGLVEPRVGNHRRPPVPRARDVEHFEGLLGDQMVEVRVDEVQRGRGAPVPQQSRLDVRIDEGSGE